MPKKRGRPEGYVMSEESKKKISKKLTGRHLSEEHRRKIAEAMKGNQNRKSKKSDDEVLTDD